MKICRNCGKLSNDDVRVCPACGLTLENRKRLKKTKEEEEKDAQNKIVVKPAAESQKDKISLKPISANSASVKDNDTLETIPVPSQPAKPIGTSGMLFGMGSGGFPLSTKPNQDTKKESINKVIEEKLEESLDDDQIDEIKPITSVDPNFPLIPIKPSDSIKTIMPEKKEPFIPLEIRVKMEKEAQLKAAQGSSIKESVSKDAISKESVSKDAISKSVISKECVSKDTISKDSGSQDIDSQQKESIQPVKQVDQKCIQPDSGDDEVPKEIRFPKRKIIAPTSQQQIKVKPVASNIVNVVTQEGFTEYIPESKLEHDLTQEKDMDELVSILSDDLKQEQLSDSDAVSEGLISFPKRRFQGFKGVKVIADSTNSSTNNESPTAGISIKSNVNSSSVTSTINISELMKNAIHDLSNQFTPQVKPAEKSEKAKISPIAKVPAPDSLLSLLKQISELDPAIEACGIIKDGEISASAISSRLNNELAKEAVREILTISDKYSNMMKMGQIMSVSITSKYGIFHIAEVKSGLLMYILTGPDTKQGLFNVVLKKIRAEIGRFL